MKPIDPISISSDIKKQNHLIIAGLVFVIASIIIFINADLYAKTPDSYAPVVVRGLTIFSFLFFGGITALLLFKRKDDKVLYMNDKGIMDKTNASSVGLIEWNDILEIEAKNIFSGKFLLITVKDPEKYIQKAPIWKKIILKLNAVTAKTPFSITLNSLQMDPETTTQLVKENYRKFKFNE